ncbi:MAG: energy transducer TonB [Deltaproteobacteria bacterium]|nr:energy transducer TonB [Deltaproteobacteria bacterium]
MKNLLIKTTFISVAFHGIFLAFLGKVDGIPVPHFANVEDIWVDALKMENRHNKQSRRWASLEHVKGQRVRRSQSKEFSAEATDITRGQGETLVTTENIRAFGNQLPEYPDEAKRRGWEGTLLLRLHMDWEGKVDIVELVQSSGYGILDEAAVHAAQKWSLPYRSEVVAVPFEYRLEG